MFDPVEAFTKAFTPLDGGYLYYPSAKAGGKLVTAEEFEVLLDDWQRVAGRRGRWKTVGLAFLPIALWVAVSQIFRLPNWVDNIFCTVLVLAISSWVLWASFAPRRLVRDRPEVAPPRSIEQARRETRALLNWRFVMFALVISGAALWANLSSLERTLGTWAWIVGSGIVFVSYLWFALQKLRDTKS